MKMNRLENNQPTETPFTTFCANYCRRLLSEIKRTKQDLVAQFRKTFAGQEQLLRLALNEAEAVAFLTDYPHLVFADLAMEKVQGVANWRAHQKHINHEPAGYARF